MTIVPLSNATNHWQLQQQNSTERLWLCCADVCNWINEYVKQGVFEKSQAYLLK